MAAGLPVIVSTGAGSARDLVAEGENGYRFDPADPEALAQHLFQLAAPDTDLQRMRDRSQQIIAAWPLERFAQGLWDAARLGLNRAGRRPDLAAQAILVGSNRLAREVTAFHTAEL